MLMTQYIITKGDIYLILAQNIVKQFTLTSIVILDH